MTVTTTSPVRHPERLFVDGDWVTPSSGALLDVIDPGSEKLYFSVAEAKTADIDRAVTSARRAFDLGPWPRLTHAERAGFLRAIADGVRDRIDELATVWARQSGMLHAHAVPSVQSVPSIFDDYADMASTYPFDDRVSPTMGGEFGLISHEPVGVVGAIVPWNAPLPLLAYKVAPALLAGCTVIVKASPEAPGEAYLFAEIAEAAGLPAGVINVVAADREVSEGLVLDPRVDKISFTGSTVAGRRIASLLGNRIGRYTLELGGKSAAVVLDDIDLGEVAATLAGGACFMSGQVCSSLTRIIVSRARHDELVDALAGLLADVRVGDAFDPDSQMGPLAMRRQRDRVETLIATGVDEGARLATGGGRPKGLDRGFYVEPTLFADVDNSSTLARNEIFGPVLSVIASTDEQDSVTIANDSIYGLNASVFTDDADRALQVARQIRSGTVGHNAWRSDFGMGCGGFKQSGIGREGGVEGLLPYLETKSIILDAVPSSFARTAEPR